MPNLIVVCGPHAVGKMTVAESLRDKLKYNLMINHDSLEISDKIFGYKTPAQREFNEVFREKAFDIALKHKVDLIFTCVCAFEMQEEKDGLTALANKFIESGGNFYFVELSADLRIRLERNATQHRLKRKPSKKDVDLSKSNLLQATQNHRLNSFHDEVWFENHLKIDNSFLSPDIAADMVIEAFKLTPNEKEANEYRYGADDDGNK